MTTSKDLKPGDKVKWNTPQGETEGTIIKKETATSKAGGHTAKATEADPEFRVKSAKSGKEAVHKPQALTKE